MAAPDPKSSATSFPTPCRTTSSSSFSMYLCVDYIVDTGYCIRSDQAAQVGNDMPALPLKLRILNDTLVGRTGHMRDHMIC